MQHVVRARHPSTNTPFPSPVALPRLCAQAARQARAAAAAEEERLNKLAAEAEAAVEAASADRRARIVALHSADVALAEAALEAATVEADEEDEVALAQEKADTQQALLMASAAESLLETAGDEAAVAEARAKATAAASELDRVTTQHEDERSRRVLGVMAARDALEVSKQRQRRVLSSARKEASGAYRPSRARADWMRALAGVVVTNELVRRRSSGSRVLVGASDGESDAAMSDGSVGDGRSEQGSVGSEAESSAVAQSGADAGRSDDDVVSEHGGDQVSGIGSNDRSYYAATDTAGNRSHSPSSRHSGEPDTKQTATSHAPEAGVVPGADAGTSSDIPEDDAWHKVYDDGACVGRGVSRGTRRAIHGSPLTCRALPVLAVTEDYYYFNTVTQESLWHAPPAFLRAHAEDVPSPRVDDTGAHAEDSGGEDDDDGDGDDDDDEVVDEVVDEVAAIVTAQEGVLCVCVGGGEVTTRAPAPCQVLRF